MRGVIAGALLVAIVSPRSPAVLADPDPTQAVLDAEASRRAKLVRMSTELAEKTRLLGCQSVLAVATLAEGSAGAERRPVIVAHIRCQADTFFESGCDELKPQKPLELYELGKALETIQPGTTVLVTGSVDKESFLPGRRTCRKRGTQAQYAAALEFWKHSESRRSTQPPDPGQKLSACQEVLGRDAPKEPETCRRVLNQVLAETRAERVAAAIRAGHGIPRHPRLPEPRALNITTIAVGLDEAWLHVHQKFCAVADCPKPSGNWQPARRADIFAVFTPTSQVSLPCPHDAPLACLEDAARMAVSASGYSDAGLLTQDWTVNASNRCIARLADALAFPGDETVARKRAALWSLAMKLLDIKEADTCNAD